MIHWEKNRDPRAGALDLIACFDDYKNEKYPDMPHGQVSKVYDYISLVEEIKPIKSRQVAAHIIVSAIQSVEWA